MLEMVNESHSLKQIKFAQTNFNFCCTLAYPTDEIVVLRNASSIDILVISTAVYKLAKSQKSQEWKTRSSYFLTFRFLMAIKRMAPFGV